MSFFRSIRSSITRGKSSSRDTTPVRNASRPGSIISSTATTTTMSRRDSTGSRADSLLNRGDTFILGSEDEERHQHSNNHSNTSTLEKKTKKSKVFSKFSTFTKRKKTPTPTEEVASYEHHPSDTATNTYYKWKSDGPDRLLDYDAQADPFNFLYEQPSSLKALQMEEANGQDATSVRHATSITTHSNGSGSGSGNGSGTFDSSTYRKSKMPTQLREQLEQLKTLSDNEHELREEEDERDKYKTITLNSFRKSFREKLLQQQKEAPHNPAWFVEVEAPPSLSTQTERQLSKENRPDFLVFENENYRPMSRSPLRERPSRSTTRSPVKRNETFRVTEPSHRLLRTMSPSPTPSTRTTTTTTRPPPAAEIRIEIKNSISPNMPSRMVPVGVAKPMPTTEYYAQRLLAANGGSPAKGYSNNNEAIHLPARGWHRSQTSSPSRNALGNTRSSGRYQTLVQIGNDGGGKSFMSRGRAPTRVQLMSGGGGQRSYANSPSGQKRYMFGTSAPATTTATTTYSSGYDNVLFKPPAVKPRHATYFGDHQQQQQQQQHQHQQQQQQQSTRTAFVNGNNTPVNRPLRQSRSALGGAGGGGGGGGSSAVYLGRREQYQAPLSASAAVSMQRRARSPIKIPWR